MSTNREFDRIPPFNLEAERSVLGACLIDRDSLLIVIESLRSEDFYDPRHKTAFEIIAAMAEQDLAVDSLTFREEIRKRGLEERLGGLPFVAELMDAVTTTANVEYHAGIVRDKSVHRGLITVGSDISRMGFSEETGIDEALETAEQKVFEIARSGRSSRLKGAREVVTSAIGEIEKRLAGGLEITGVPSGFNDFDKLSGGLQPGSLYILAARPSMGKTTFSLNIAENAALKEGKSVVIFSLEMSKEQLAYKLLCSQANVDMLKLRTGNLDDDDWERIARATGPLSKAKIYIDDTAGITVMEMRSKCRKIKMEHGIDMILIDYLQLMSGSSGNDNRQQEVSEISRSIKALAKEMECPVIALSQLSRAPEQRADHRPMLSDLRESGSIEQDADVVMFLYRDEYYNKETEEKGIGECIIAKQRNGPVGTVKMAWIGAHSKFADLELVHKE